MIFFQKASLKAPKHSHNPQLVLIMGIAGARVKYNILDSALAAYPSSPLVSAPQIAVDDDGGNSLPIVYVMIPYEPWHYLCGRLFY